MPMSPKSVIIWAKSAKIRAFWQFEQRVLAGTLFFRRGLAATAQTHATHP
jgi:hypothetical protein